MGIKEGIILDQIPIPPSENEAYPTDFQTGRRFTGKEMVEFKSRMQAWSLRRALAIHKIMEELKWELADHRKVIRIDVYFHFQYESLFTKPKTKLDRPRRKKMDPHNRIKALFDCLSVMLAVDDCRFIIGEVVPIQRTNPQGQFTQIRMTIDRIQTDEEFAGSNQVQQKI